MLEKGKVSYLIGDSWHLPAFYMGDSGASLFGKDGLTASDGQQLQLTPFAGSKAVGYNPNTDHYEVAAMFAAYLGSTEAQKAHYDMRQIIPSDKSLASDSAIAADPMAKAQIDTVNNASVVQPVISQMADFWKPAESFGKGILNGEVTVDNAAEKTEAWASGYNFK